jgi:hypothetical protein
MRSRITFNIVALYIILEYSLLLASINNVDAVKSKRPMGRAKQPALMSDVEYFQRRWSARASPASTYSLIDISSSEASVNPSTESLSVRGGSSTASQFASTQLYSVNVANELPMPQASIATVSDSKLAVQPRIPFLEYMMYPGETSTRTVQQRVFGISKCATGYKQLARLSALTFVLSNVMFFAGTHLETVWTNTKPHLRQWLQGRRNHTNQRAKFMSRAYSLRQADPAIGRRRLYLTVAVTIGMFAAPLLTTVGGATVLCAQRIAESANENNNNNISTLL